MKTAIAHYRAYTAKSQFLVCIVFLTIAVFSILFSATCFGKTVLLDIDGEQQQLFVFAKDVEDVLSQADVTVESADKLSHNLYDEVQHGQVLYVKKAIPVQFEINGKETQFLTTAHTVLDFLGENNIALTEFDEISPALDTVLSKNSRVVLAKSEVEIVTKTEEIPFKTVSVPNYQADVGSSKVKTEGENGVKETSYMRIWRNGEVVHETSTEETVIKEPVNKVVEYGTVMASMNYRGGNVKREDITYSRMIQMTATAYDLSFQSCGKRPGDRGYGITASGMRAQRGVVAVDPRVIPLGTRLYIETADGSYIYGNAVAGDTGGAIKGNKIDLFMNSYSECMQFGRRTVNVYILD
ncbi:MAG: DUF348 domain-containing protein [Clostridia bacterium]|nr:DUF348 domain-containing protein [Clostridia bacterium]